jgi:polyisoprenoid-binding protein YceI
MTRTLARTALVAFLVVSGCANPADDKFKVTATPPRPVVEPPVPAPAATGTETATATATAEPSANALLIASDEGSKIEFIGSKVTGSHQGGFKSFRGTAELAPDQASVSRIAVTIDMGSTWTDTNKLTNHLKTPDFFDVARFPNASFVTTEITPGGEKGATHTVTGNLTLHGVTKSISFPATITVKDGAVALTSEFALNRKDFGVSYAGKADDLIRDEVVIKIDVKGARKA